MALFAFRQTLYSFLLTLGSFIHVVSLDNAFLHLSACCAFQDYETVLFEFGLRFTYNKTLVVEYNSTRGNWQGFTEPGMKWAHSYNGDPNDPARRELEEIILCSNVIKYHKERFKLTSAPSVKLSLVKQSSGTTYAVLLCSAYNFYPQDIELTWLKNGQEVTSDVTSTEVLSDGDLEYQIHSYLEYIPKLGEEISCMVEHLSLSKPLVQKWDPHDSLPWPERFKMAAGTCFLVVGLTVLTVGCFKQKKRSAALCTGMQGCQMVPVEVVHDTEASLD